MLRVDLFYIPPLGNNWDLFRDCPLWLEHKTKYLKVFLNLWIPFLDPRLYLYSYKLLVLLEHVSHIFIHMKTIIIGSLFSSKV